MLQNLTSVYKVRKQMPLLGDKQEDKLALSLLIYVEMY